MRRPYPPVDAKLLSGASPLNDKRRSLRKIAAELAKIGEALIASGTPGAKEAAPARNGQPYSAKSVRAMLPALHKCDESDPRPLIESLYWGI